MQAGTILLAASQPTSLRSSLSTVAHKRLELVQQAMGKVGLFRLQASWGAAASL